MAATWPGTEMMKAAPEGGLAFRRELGAVHSLSHALGAIRQLKLHHGKLNAILLPNVVRFNAPAVGDKIERLLSAMGLPAKSDLADELDGLNRRLGVPPSLGALGMTAEMFPPCRRAGPARPQPRHKSAPVDGRELHGHPQISKRMIGSAAPLEHPPTVTWPTPPGSISRRLSVGASAYSAPGVEDRCLTTNSLPIQASRACP